MNEQERKKRKRRGQSKMFHTFYCKLISNFGHLTSTQFGYRWRKSEVVSTVKAASHSSMSCVCCPLFSHFFSLTPNMRPMLSASLESAGDEERDAEREILTMVYCGNLLCQAMCMTSASRRAGGVQRCTLWTPQHSIVQHGSVIGQGRNYNAVCLGRWNC